jgi:hypothetical protein
MIKIDFDKTKPDFVNGDFKWYIDKHFQNYIENKQAENLPKLIGLGCFIVKSIEVEDYVLIDNKQNVIDAYPYTFEGYGQMEAKINSIKIHKHFEEYEKTNV